MGAESELVVEIMGIPVRFRTDDPELLSAVQRGYESWPGAPPSPAGPQIQIQIHLSRCDTPQMGRNAATGAIPGVPLITLQGDRLRFVGEDCEGEAHATRREARCRISSRLIVDPERLVSESVDTLLLFLLTRVGRVPLHAAGVMIGGTAVLLAGPSGSGKSTLAHTAALFGLPLLSDDAVYLQQGEIPLVWGFPRPIHLLPDAVTGESRVAATRRVRGGREKVAISFPAAGPPGNVATQAALCLLERGDMAALAPLDSEVAVHRLVETLDAGFDHFRQLLPSALAGILAGRCAWRLTLSPDPGEGLALIRERFGGGAA